MRWGWWLRGLPESVWLHPEAGIPDEWWVPAWELRHPAEDRAWRWAPSVRRRWEPGRVRWVSGSLCEVPGRLSRYPDQLALDTHPAG